MTGKACPVITRSQFDPAQGAVISHYRRPGRLPRPDRPAVVYPGARWRIVGYAVFVGQFVGLLVWSRHLWSRYRESSDFALYAQAWHLIGTGHLDPYSTIYPYNYPSYGYLFIRNHFELGMWVFAVLHPLWSSSYVLLVAQDAALAGMCLVTYLWAVDLVGGAGRRSGLSSLVLVAVLGLLVINPFVYETASFDFHLQPFAILFLVLTGRSLWARQRLRAVVFSVCTLLFGVPVSLYVVGVGVAAAVMLQRRRSGMAVAAVGVVWLFAAGSFDLDIGSHVGTHYGYLIGRPDATDRTSAATIAAGLLTHPGNVWSVLHHRWRAVYRFVASGGLVGVATPIGLLLAATVLVPNALNSNPAFIGDQAAFQSLAAVPFVLVGSVILVRWLHRQRPGPSVAVVAGAASVVASVAVAVSLLPKIPSQWAPPTVAEAATLQRAFRAVPAGAEVISTATVMGRLAGRSQIYPVEYPTQQFPVKSAPVYFVFYNDPGMAHDAATKLGAADIAASGAVEILRWNPPPNVRTVVLES